MTEDLMELISELQERYQIDQEDVDVLVSAIEETYAPSEEMPEMDDQSVPEMEIVDEEEEF